MIVPTMVGACKTPRIQTMIAAMSAMATTLTSTSRIALLYASVLPSRVGPTFGALKPETNAEEQERPKEDG